MRSKRASGGLASSAANSGQCGTPVFAKQQAQIVRDLVCSRRSNATSRASSAARSKRSADAGTRSTSGRGSCPTTDARRETAIPRSTLPFAKTMSNAERGLFPNPTPRHDDQCVARDLHVTSFRLCSRALRRRSRTGHAKPAGRSATAGVRREVQDGLGLEIRVASPSSARAQMPCRMSPAPAPLPARFRDDAPADRSGLGPRSMTQSAAAMTSSGARRPARRARDRRSSSAFTARRRRRDGVRS